MSYFQRPIRFVGRSLAVTALLSASALLAGAQNGSSGNGTTTLSGDQPELNLQLPAVDVSTQQLFSSSSTTAGDDVLVASNTDRFNFVNAMQYNGRRRYGRPRYRGGNSNQDGSAKYTAFVGGGFTSPVTDNTNFLKTSWAFGGGVGRNFNNTFGVNLEFNWDNFGLDGQTLSNQLALYNGIITLYNRQNPSNAAALLTSLNGHNHVWSFSLNPKVNLGAAREGISAYVTGGAGFYHKVTDFTVPSVGTYCDYYYGCYNYQANQTIDHYTSNAFGLNGGLGLDYKLSRFANTKIFAEARYVYTFNQYRPGVTLANLSLATAALANDFPQNSQRTAYVPVKIGLRF